LPNRKYLTHYKHNVLHVLLNIRESVPERSRAKEHDVPLIFLASSKALIRAV
jgi:hypothetical protein